MRALITVLILVCSVEVQAATLYVNNTGSPVCSDATLKVNNNASSPWCTVGRAVWGQTTWSLTGTPLQAIAGGDTLYIIGDSTYNDATSIDSPSAVLYDPVNSGTSDNPIILIASGDITLTCPACESPVAGSNSNYVYWIVENFTTNPATSDNWVIVACAEAPGGGITNCPGSGVATGTPDTGPVYVSGTGSKFIGGHITGYNLAPYEPPDDHENWPAIRVQGADDCVVTNNYIRDFLNNIPDSHAIGINIYDARNCIVENNDIANSGGCISLKDNLTMTLFGNRVRFNKCEDVIDGLILSLQGTGTEDRNYLTQNLIIDASSFCLVISGAINDWILNNTCIRPGNAFINIGGTTPTVNGVRVLGNISYAGLHGIFNEDVMAATSVLHLQRNLYDAFTGNFYDSDAQTDRATLQLFKDNHAGHEEDSVDADPVFVNYAGGDFRTCIASGNPVGCAGAGGGVGLSLDIFDLDSDGSTVDMINAGAYINGTEIIGLTAGAQAVTPVGSGGLMRIRK